MKRLCCLLLCLCLLPGCALAEDDWDEDDLDEFGENWMFVESRFGYSLWYNADQLSFWTGEFEGAVAEYFCPWYDHSGIAAMICLGSRFSTMLWDDYTPIDLDNVYVYLDDPYEMTAYTDGETILEQWIISVADADYVFIIQYEADDVQNWAILFHDTLSGVEFPPQPAVFRDDLRLDFFQGGAAGMRFIDVVIDADAEPVVLMPLRELKDFSLEKIIWDGETFTPLSAEPLYTADALSPGDNLKIYCFFPDILPDLSVVYTDAEGLAWCLNLFQSGRDGSLLLIPEEAYSEVVD